MEEDKIQPDKIEDRIIFTAMLNDIEVRCCQEL